MRFEAIKHELKDAQRLKGLGLKLQDFRAKGARCVDVR